MGEYASGKSEVALNRALSLFKSGREPVTLVDFDLVEPFYTLRPLKKELEKKGIKVLAWETLNTLGFGEIGTLLKPEIRWALKNQGNVVIDVGYGVAGAKKLMLLEKTGMKKALKIYVVINIARPFTSDVTGIVDYVKTMGCVHGLINNSHWGDDTDLGIVEEGTRVVTEAARILGLPVIWTTVEKRFAEQIGEYDFLGNPVLYLERWMHCAFW